MSEPMSFICSGCVREASPLCECFWRAGYGGPGSRRHALQAGSGLEVEGAFTIMFCLRSDEREEFEEDCKRIQQSLGS